MLCNPEEMRGTKIMGEFMTQIQLATINGLKGKDDCLDTISMLMHLTPWKPSDGASELMGHNGGPDWDDDNTKDDANRMSSYIV